MKEVKVVYCPSKENASADTLSRGFANEIYDEATIAMATANDLPNFSSQ